MQLCYNNGHETNTKPSGPLSNESDTSTSCMFQSGRSATELPVARHSYQNNSTNINCHNTSLYLPQVLAQKLLDRSICRRAFQALPSTHSKQRWTLTTQLSFHVSLIPTPYQVLQLLNSDETLLNFIHKDPPLRHLLLARFINTSPAKTNHHNTSLHTSHTNSKLTAPFPEQSQPSSLTHSQKLPATLSSSSNNK